MSKVFTCLYCGATYLADRSLKRHYRSLPEHRPTSSTNVGSNVQNADIVVNEFINVGDRYKVARLRNLAECVTKGDALNYLLPVLRSRLSLYEIFLSCIPGQAEEKENLNSPEIRQMLYECLNVVNEKHPEELKYVLNCNGIRRYELSTPVQPINSALPLSPIGNTPTPDEPKLQNRRQVLVRRNLFPFIEDINITQPCSIQTVKSISTIEGLKLQNEKVFKDNVDIFNEISTQILTCFDISRRDYHTILRSMIGKRIENVLGINPFVSKNQLEETLKAKANEHKASKNLQFIEYKETVAAFTDIAKSIQCLLKKKSLANIIQVPNKCIIVFHYLDLFPWLPWSRHFNGETTGRLKILEPTNTYSSASTVISWLGPDKYEFVSALAKNVFDQFNNVQEVYHPLIKENVKVHVRGLADGAQRRSYLGASTACSTYPIPESFEHRYQLGDLSMFQPKLTITVEDTIKAASDYKKFLGFRESTNYLQKSLPGAILD